MVPWKWILVAAADMAPLHALLVLVAGVAFAVALSFAERVMFMPAMLAGVGGVRFAGRLFWK